MAKPRILFLHGGPGMDSDYFFPYFHSLENDFDLFCYKQKADTIHALVNELSEQINKHSPDSIIAHSWGAFLLLAGLDAKPDIFASLRHVILISPMPLTAVRCKQAMEVIQSRFSKTDAALYNEMKDRIETTGADLMTLLLSYYHHDRNFVMATPYFDRVLSKIINGQLGDFDNRAHVKLLPRSTLVLYGSADYTTPEREYRDLPEATIEIIEGAGHFAFAERFEKVIPRIHEFLKS